MYGKFYSKIVSDGAKGLFMAGVLFALLSVVAGAALAWIVWSSI